MKKIKLSQRKYALVDDEDYEYLNQWKWCVCKRKKTSYAIGLIKINGCRTQVLMHRLIMNTPPIMETDHIDHDGLNNQKSNLRNCTKQQNAWNRQATGSSKYRGVSVYFVTHKHCISKYIAAHISVNSKSVHLGHFKTEEDAARAFDQAAKKHHGEFANLNFK